MTTLFLGDFGNAVMAAEAALIEAVRSIGDPDPIVVTATPAFTARCVPGLTCITPGTTPPRPPRQVVLAGPIGRPERALALIADFTAATADGLPARLHNLSLPAGLPPPDTLRIAERIAGATGSLRDHVTMLVMLRRRLPWLPELAAYPERTLQHDDSLAALLPDGPPPIGMMLDGSPAMLACLEQHPQAFAAALGPPEAGPVLPIPDTARGLSDARMGDAVFASRRALLTLRPGQAPLLPALLDTGWWHEHATPAGLAGLVRRCAAVVTTTDLGVVLAAAAGIPCHIIGYTLDDPATRAGGTLAGVLAPGSSFVVLR